VADRKRVRAKRPPFRERLEQGDTYGLLLILIVATYFEVAIVEKSQWAQVLLAISFAGVLLLTLHTSHVRGRWTRITLIVSVIVIAFTTAQAIVGNEAVAGASYIWIAFIVASPVVILARIFRHPRIDLETILGAVCAYLMIGIGFSTIYVMLQQLGSENFFTQPGPYQRIDFLYFSFVVLTTLGFGDFTPGTPVGKVLVTLEALIGQVFLVTVVASLVAGFGGVMRRSALDLDQDDPDDDEDDEDDEEDDEEDSRRATDDAP
jgi:voltage-gated potassium channel Kch